jgi:hypothetical protein
LVEHYEEDRKSAKSIKGIEVRLSLKGLEIEWSLLLHSYHTQAVWRYRGTHPTIVQLTESAKWSKTLGAWKKRFGMAPLAECYLPTDSTRRGCGAHSLADFSGGECRLVSEAEPTHPLVLPRAWSFAAHARVVG